MSIIESAIGWLAPPLCVSCGEEGSVLCEACISSEIIPFGTRCWRCGSLSERSRTCTSCRSGTPPRCVWVSTDYIGAAKDLLVAYKFGHLRAGASAIASLMAQTFKSFNSDQMMHKKRYLVVPVPTATSRVRERGFGHSELLAKHIARELHLELCSALRRSGQQRQVGARRVDRILQIKDSYYVRSGDKVRGRNVLLIDDVLTTGATLQATTKALRQAGALHVDALLFAKKL